jgi:hypothetical protein
MKPQRLTVRYLLQEDTYYELSLRLTSWRTVTPEQSTLIVVSKEKVVFEKILSTPEITASLIAIKAIRIDFEAEDEASSTRPLQTYHLQIQSETFNLNFHWNDDSYGYRRLYRSLARLIKTIERMAPVNSEALGLPPRLDVM